MKIEIKLCFDFFKESFLIKISFISLILIEKTFKIILNAIDC